MRQDLEILIQAIAAAAALARHRRAPAPALCQRAGGHLQRPAGAARRSGSAGAAARRARPSPQIHRRRDRIQALHRARAGTGARAAPAQGTARTVREQVERDLGNISFFGSGLDELFKKYDLAEAAPLLATLKTQFTAYEQAVRAELLPRTRTDFKLPPDLYASNLEQFGVDLPPAELVTIAHQRL